MFNFRSLWPALLMIVMMAAYVLWRVAPAQRLGTFAMLALTAFAGAQLVTVASMLLDKETARRRILPHALSMAGALLMALSYLDARRTLLFAVGASVFAAGMLLWHRGLRAPG